jgi:hypothetical protein
MLIFVESAHNQYETIEKSRSAGASDPFLLLEWWGRYHRHIEQIVAQNSPKSGISPHRSGVVHWIMKVRYGTNVGQMIPMKNATNCN